MRKQFVDIAIDEAYKSFQNHKHGAVVVRGGKLIASGHNKVTTRCPSHMFSVHAEMAAIKHVSSRAELIDCHVYVVRVGKCGLARSDPCVLCQRFMKMHGVSRVFFSTGDETKRFGSLYI